MPGETIGSTAKPARIGEILEQCGLVNHAQLEAGLAYARDHKLRLGEALIRLGHLNEDKLTWALGVQFDLSYVDLDDGMIDWDFLARLPLDDLERLLFLPLVSIGETIHAVIADPTVEGKTELLQSLFPDQRVIVQLASASEIRDVITRARKGGKRSLSVDASTRLEDWLDDIRAGRARGLLAVPSTDSIGIADVRFLDNKTNLEQIAQAEIAALRDYLKVSGDRPSWGILPVESETFDTPVRWFSWSTLRGFAIGLEAIPKAGAPHERSHIHVIGSPDLPGVKAEALKMLASDQHELPLITFELQVVEELAGAIQSQIPYVQERVALALQLGGLIQLARVFIEFETPFMDISRNFHERILGGGKLIALIHDDFGTRDMHDFWDTFKPHITYRFVSDSRKVTPDIFSPLPSKGDSQ